MRHHQQQHSSIRWRPSKYSFPFLATSIRRQDAACIAQSCGWLSKCKNAYGDSRVHTVCVTTQVRGYVDVLLLQPHLRSRELTEARARRYQHMRRTDAICTHPKYLVTKQRVVRAGNGAPCLSYMGDIKQRAHAPHICRTMVVAEAIFSQPQ